MMVVVVVVTKTTSSNSLAILATRLMSPQIVQPGEAPRTPQLLMPALDVLVLGIVVGHVASEIGAFGVQRLMADRAVHSFTVMAARHVLVPHLLVHERFVAACDRAFPGPFFVRGGPQVFFGQVACQCGFAGECRCAAVPAAGGGGAA